MGTSVLYRAQPNQLEKNCDLLDFSYRNEAWQCQMHCNNDDNAGYLATIEKASIDLCGNNAQLVPCANGVHWATQGPKRSSCWMAWISLIDSQETSTERAQFFFFFHPRTKSGICCMHASAGRSRNGKLPVRNQIASNEVHLASC